MKRLLLMFALWATLAPLSAGAQTKEARALLDKTAEAFRKAGGVEIAFGMKAYTDGKPEGESAGVIRLKGEKFRLEVPGNLTWFDGETQWTYVEENEEVNVSTPTDEELRSINPYTFIYMYREGFDCRLGEKKAQGGRIAQEVVLTATDPKQDLASVTLLIEAGTYRPLSIRLEQRGTKTVSEITVTAYRTGQRYADKDFTFNPSDYPDAEVIDLR